VRFKNRLNTEIGLKCHGRPSIPRAPSHVRAAQRAGLPLAGYRQEPLQCARRGTFSVTTYIRLFRGTGLGTLPASENAPTWGCCRGAPGGDRLVSARPKPGPASDLLTAKGSPSVSPRRSPPRPREAPRSVSAGKSPGTPNRSRRMHDGAVHDSRCRTSRRRAPSAPSSRSLTAATFRTPGPAKFASSHEVVQVPGVAPRYQGARDGPPSPPNKRFGAEREVRRSSLIGFCAFPFAAYCHRPTFRR